ncbi:MAG: PriCT-2 domain-containing protein [Gallionellaceae bacterium]|jgi:hypothetical protein
MTISQHYPGFKRSSSQSNPRNLERVQNLLEQLDPDLPYAGWLRVLMGIYHESGGSEEGFELANAWSSLGQKYKGEKEIRSKWRSFTLKLRRPVTIGTLISMANNQH